MRRCKQFHLWSSYHSPHLLQPCWASIPVREFLACGCWSFISRDISSLDQRFPASLCKYPKISIKRLFDLLSTNCALCRYLPFFPPLTRLTASFVSNILSFLDPVGFILISKRTYVAARGLGSGLSASVHPRHWVDGIVATLMKTRRRRHPTVKSEMQSTAVAE